MKMILTDYLREVIKALSAMQWKWDMTSVQSLAVRCGYSKMEEVPGRVSFAVEPSNTIDFSIYYQDGGVEFVEITFDRFLSPESLTESEYENTVDEYYELFNRAADIGVEILGKPTFRNGFGNSGFPDDQDAVWLALWKRPDARFIVAQKHEDRDAPFRICLCITPPAG